MNINNAISGSPEAELDLAVNGLLYSYIDQIQANNQQLINQNKYLQFQLKYHVNLKNTLNQLILENEKLKQENNCLKNQLMKGYVKKR